MIILCFIPSEKSFGPTNFKIFSIWILIIFWIYYYNIPTFYLIILLPTSTLITMYAARKGGLRYFEKNYDAYFSDTFTDLEKEQKLATRIAPKLEGMWFALFYNILFVLSFMKGLSIYSTEELIVSWIFVSIVCYYSLVERSLWQATDGFNNGMTGWIAFPQTISVVLLYISAFFIFDHWAIALILLFTPTVILQVAYNNLFKHTNVSVFIYQYQKFYISINLLLLWVLYDLATSYKTLIFFMELGG